MPKKTSKYKITIKHVDDTYKATGDTIFETLESFNFEPHLIKTKCVLTISNGKEKKEQVMTAFQIKKIVKTKMFREILAGKLSFLLGEK